jgi:hypothetical protein
MTPPEPPIIIRLLVAGFTLPAATMLWGCRFSNFGKLSSSLDASSAHATRLTDKLNLILLNAAR